MVSASRFGERLTVSTTNEPVKGAWFDKLCRHGRETFCCPSIIDGGRVAVLIAPFQEAREGTLQSCLREDFAPLRIDNFPCPQARNPVISLRSRTWPEFSHTRRMTRLATVPPVPLSRRAGPSTAPQVVGWRFGHFTEKRPRAIARGLFCVCASTFANR